MASTSSSSTVTAPSTDVAGAAAVPQRIVAAWADHDAEAFAAVFTEDGSMILPGLYLKGRDQISAYMAAAFSGPYQGTRVTGSPIDIRFLGSDVGLLITAGGVLAPGETEVSRESAIRASWLVVRKDDQWQLAAYQNSQADV